MKKFFLFFFMPLLICFAQVGYVPIDHKIYNYFCRMETLGLIENYNSFETPKSRIEVSKYLQEINQNRNQLNYYDNKILDDLIYEFDFELNFKMDNYSSVITKNTQNYFEKEKYLYSYADSSKASFFVNLIGESFFLIDKKDSDNNSRNALIYLFGGVFRGTIANHYGFSIKATNGSYKGNKELALSQKGLRYNYKANINPNYAGSNSYFDETEGYIAAEFTDAKIKIGRDRLLLGYGIDKCILSDNPPPLDYFMFNLKYSIFSFSYIHAKLLSYPTSIGDSISGQINHLNEKFMVYHRFELDLSKHAKIGFGEIIIYGNRGFDFSYLNPFNFFKSIEHVNQDRDNSMMFFDFSNNSIKGIKPYFTLMIDDIDFGKIGTLWYGNQVLFDAGVSFVPFYKEISSMVTVQYTRIEPYFYTHRIPYNDFTSLGYGLSSFTQPNSENYTIKIDYFPHNRTSVSFRYTYGKHGENEYDNEGNLTKNYGGNIKYGHRINDAEKIKFLDGVLEKRQLFSASANYEFIRNYYIDFSFNYIKLNVNDHKTSELFSIFSLKLKI
ncbi:MAG: capsule assembly Wzi family protein [bacterium]